MPFPGELLVKYLPLNPALFHRALHKLNHNRFVVNQAVNLIRGKNAFCVYRLRRQFLSP